MQFMADFLLEPGAGQPANNVKKTSLEPASRNGGSAGAFSSVYAQQQQMRELERRQADQIARSESSNAAAADRRTDERPVSGADRAAPGRPASKPEKVVGQSADKKSVAGKNSQEVDSESGKALPQADDGTGADSLKQRLHEGVEMTDALADKDNALLAEESEAESTSLVAQMDPLLLQIMQARQGGDDEGLLPDESDLAGEETAEGLLAAPLAAVAGADEAKTGNKAGSVLVAGGRGTEQAAGLLQAGTVSGEADEAVAEELEVAEAQMPDMKPEGKPELAQALLQNVRQERNDGRSLPGQPAVDVKTAADGVVRGDTLMRTESVQQAAAARQVPGGPLAMQQPGWSKELTDKVMWMSSQNLKSAEIRLNPAELGRLEIRIQMAGEQTQVNFVSPHAGVRDSLESQAYRLREFLAQQGMNDVDVNVSDQQGSEKHGEAGEGRPLGDMHVAEAEADEEEGTVQGQSELPQTDNGHGGMHSYYV